MQSNALLHETVGLLLGHFAFAAAALLVHHALVQVGLPAKRIHVDLAELRVQMPDLVHHFVQQSVEWEMTRKPPSYFFK